LAASTDELPPCGTFTLFGGPFENFVLDFAKKNDSVGDERIGDRELGDSDGNVVATARRVTTVLETDAGDGNDTPTLAEDVLSLPDGTIHAEGELVYQTILKPETQPESPPISAPMAIIGGTGACVRSDGEIQINFAPGQPAEYIFKLFCQ
jgi:hypothetical protein